MGNSGESHIHLSFVSLCPFNLPRHETQGTVQLTGSLVAAFVTRGNQLDFREQPQAAIPAATVRPRKTKA